MQNTKNQIRVSDFLKEENILFFPSNLPKEQLFEKLIDSLELPNAAMALKAIMDRELWGSTMIAPGLALPHARIPGIRRVAAALGICSSVPQIYLLFLGPADNVQEHLAFLASVSSLFQIEGFLNMIVPLNSPAPVLAKIRSLEK